MKRLFDIFVSGAGLLVLAPIAAIISAAIKLEDGGPVFFVQERVGKDCRVFPAFKFRSMIVDAEKHTGAVQAVHNDPRVTSVGRLLRATAFDELPQLLNIFKGDMPSRKHTGMIRRMVTASSGRDATSCSQRGIGQGLPMVPTHITIADTPTASIAARNASSDASRRL